MTIALITDGMLYPIGAGTGRLRAPNGSYALAGTAPVTPYGAIAEDPTKTKPETPTTGAAFGPTVPAVPCGTTGYDPTINPPEVPTGAQASEEPGAEAPAVPKCPEGRET